MRQWISDCTQSHRTCAKGLHGIHKWPRRSHSSCPVRLIEIDSSTQPPNLRLVEFFAGIPPYLTLSHRWGVIQPIRTTSTNITHHKNSISLPLLPKTFADAIQIAQAVAVNYIWIDSICIIQDSKPDWTGQSEQMGMIYRNSICTLAATDAHLDGDEDGGLFMDSDVLPFTVSLKNNLDLKYGRVRSDPEHPAKMVYTLNEKAVDIAGESETAWERSLFTVKPNLSSFEASIELSQWNSRAWIFQERMLSTRLLYFTKEQIFWECAEQIKSEYDVGKSTTETASHPEIEGGAGRLHTALRHMDNPQDDASCLGTKSGDGAAFSELWDEHRTFRLWWLLVERYSASKLTYNTDKWYAIAGLSSILERTFRCRNYIGIWGRAVGAGILWHARDEALRPYEDYRAPTWSWLGVNGAVSFAYRDDCYLGYAQRVRPLFSASFGEQEVESDIFEPGILRLSCPSKRATISMQRLDELHFSEFTGRHDHDPAAWQAFDSLSHGKSQLELSREFRFHALPSRTRFLTEDGRVIGWAVMDSDRHDAAVEVLCAAIALRKLNNHRSPEQEIVECVLLVNHPSRPGFHLRVGRGRIVEYGWLVTCETQTHRVV